MLKGGCFCGAVRYDIAGAPFQETNCHCSICRRTTGAPFVAWFSVRGSEFLIVQGSPASFRSTEKATRDFCRDCGTQITFQHDDSPDEIDVATCSLDEPELVPPKDHTYVSSQLKWIKLADGLPEYRAARLQG